MLPISKLTVLKISISKETDNWHILSTGIHPGHQKWSKTAFKMSSWGKRLMHSTLVTGHSLMKFALLSLGKICHRKAQKTSVQLLWLPATTHQPTGYRVHTFIPATRGCQGVCQLVSRLVCLRSEVPAAPLTLKATNLCYLTQSRS